MEPEYRVGEKVTVDVGGCVANRTEGVVVSVLQRPELTTYEVDFPGYRAGPGLDRFYMADRLTRLAR
jgi:hypothetical protein